MENFGKIYRMEDLPWDIKSTLAIPNGVEEIQGVAPFYCKDAIKKVTFPCTLQKIGEGAFDGFSSLVDLNFPYNLKEIGERAFNSCDRLKSISLPFRLQEIGNEAFACCTSLKTVYFPSGLRKIGKSAFSECDSLYSVSFFEGIEEIEECCFWFCPISSISLPKSLRKIGDAAFGYNSFYEIAIPEQIQEISTACFFSCKNLTTVLLPAGLRKIKEDAFSGCEWMQTIVLPDGLEEIGKDAFKGCKRLKKIVISAGVRKFGEFVLGYSNILSGMNCPKGVDVIREQCFAECDSDLDIVCPPHLLPGKKVNLPDWVEVIKRYPFLDINKIEEIVIPKSVRKIETNAFKGCKKLKKIIFEQGSVLEEIGSKAFFDAPIVEVNLPDTVTILADDAFSKMCIVSVGGEMPEYKKRLSEIEQKKREIKLIKEFHIPNNEQNLFQINEELAERNLTISSEFSNISRITAEIDAMTQALNIKKLEDQKCVDSIDCYVAQVEHEIRDLSEQKKRCSLFAISKRKDLNLKISLLKEKLESEVNKRNIVLQKFAEENERQLHALNDKKRELCNLSNRKLDYDKRTQELLVCQKNIQEQLAAQRENLLRMEASLLMRSEKLISDHNVWLTARKAQREKIRQDEWKEEKNKLLSKLKLPVVPYTPSWSYESHDALVEESLLNEYYYALDREIGEAKRIVQYNECINKHQSELSRIRELNELLGMSMSDGIPDLVLSASSDFVPAELPERFVFLNAYYKKSDVWKQLKLCSKGVSCKDKEILKSCKNVFVFLEYIPFYDGKKVLLCFPYCMVLFQENAEMKVFSYEGASVSLKTRMEEIEDTLVPPHAELVKEQYKYCNIDGSPNRRYKENPIVKTVRYTTAVLTFEQEKFRISVSSLDLAERFADQFHGMVRFLSTEMDGGVYGSVCASADLLQIKDLIRDQKKAEKERIRLERLRAEEEARHLEELRQAEERAAEERRKALIQQQKELNEERRRKLAEEEERKKRVESMFRDDFEKDGSSGKEPSVKIKTSEIEVPFEVIGKRMISNSVFKVTLRCLDSVPLGTVTASFVSLCGERISNLKHIALQAGEDVTLGFVLNPGRDFAEMKGCYLRLESEGVMVGDFLFEMNISFSNDF